MAGKSSTQSALHLGAERIEGMDMEQIIFHDCDVDDAADGWLAVSSQKKGTA